jgi:hypothetical protein
MKVDFNELQEEVKRDVVFDESNVSNTIVKVPQLHTKYMNLLHQMQLQVIITENKYNKIYRKKYMYYRDDFEILLKGKDEIKLMVDSDEELVAVRSILQYEKTICEYLEGVVKQISGFSFLIRDFIEYEKFQAGG